MGLRWSTRPTWVDKDRTRATRWPWMARETRSSRARPPRSTFPPQIACRAICSELKTASRRSFETIRNFSARRSASQRQRSSPPIEPATWYVSPVRMPKRNEIKKVLIIGSGPIVIGQACEFDYSGAQAIKAMREEGVEVVLLNSNPATIMTDPEFAHPTYIEPITAEEAEQLIARE